MTACFFPSFPFLLLLLRRPERASETSIGGDRGRPWLLGWFHRFFQRTRIKKKRMIEIEQKCTYSRFPQLLLKGRDDSNRIPSLFFSLMWEIELSKIAP